MNAGLLAQCQVGRKFFCEVTFFEKDQLNRKCKRDTFSKKKGFSLKVLVHCFILTQKRSKICHYSIKLFGIVNPSLLKFQL